VQHSQTGIYGKSRASWAIRLFSERKFMEHINEKFKIIFSGVDYEESVPFAGSRYPMKTFFLMRK
jgi:hypothetical protein